MLTISNLVANYFIPDGVPDKVAVRTRLDQLLQRQLPQATSGWLQPTPSDEEAVYRIRHLHFDLWIDYLGMDEGEIVQRCAALSLRAVSHALLYGAANEVARFDDPAHYVAVFLIDLLAGQAWSRWVYEEFRPLRELTVGQIAAQLLANRPALLLPVARRLAQAYRLEPLIQAMTVTDIRLLLRDGLGFVPPPALPSGDYRRLLHLLAAHVHFERQAGHAAAARNTLRAYLAVALADPSAANDPAVMAVAHHLALVVSLWSARPAPWLWQALANGEIDSPLALQPLLGELGAELQQAATWLAALLADTKGRRYLAELVPVALPTPAHQAAEGQKHPATLPERITTAFAGLALLLPSIRSLDLYPHIGREGIYQLLLAAVGRTLQPLAWSDEGIGWMAGLAAGEMEEARAVTFNAPLLLPVGIEADPALEATLALAYVVIHHFARGLRGFANSSPEFVAKQFLNLPGLLVRSHDSLEVACLC